MSGHYEYSDWLNQDVWVEDPPAAKTAPVVAAGLPALAATQPVAPVAAATATPDFANMPGLSFGGYGGFGLPATGNIPAAAAPGLSASAPAASGPAPAAPVVATPVAATPPAGHYETTYDGQDVWVTDTPEYTAQINAQKAAADAAAAKKISDLAKSGMGGTFNQIDQYLAANPNTSEYTDPKTGLVYSKNVDLGGGYDSGIAGTGETLGYNSYNPKTNQITNYDASGNITYNAQKQKDKGFFGDLMSSPIMPILVGVLAPELIPSLGAWAAPAVNAALGVASGQDPTKIIQNAALSYVGGQVAQGVGGLGDQAGAASTYGTDLGSQQTAMLAAQDAGMGTASDVAGNLAGKVAGQIVSSGGKIDPVAALLSGGLSEGTNAVLGQIDGFSELSKGEQAAVKNIVTQTLQTGNLSPQALVNSAIAVGNSAADASKATDPYFQTGAGTGALPVVTAADTAGTTTGALPTTATGTTATDTAGTTTADTTGTGALPSTLADTSGNLPSMDSGVMNQITGAFSNPKDLSGNASVNVASNDNASALAALEDAKTAAKIDNGQPVDLGTVGNTLPDAALQPGLNFPGDQSVPTQEQQQQSVGDLQTALAESQQSDTPTAPQDVIKTLEDSGLTSTPETPVTVPTQAEQQSAIDQQTQQLLSDLSGGTDTVVTPADVSNPVFKAEPDAAGTDAEFYKMIGIDPTTIDPFKNVEGELDPSDLAINRANKIDQSNQQGNEWDNASTGDDLFTTEPPPEETPIDQIDITGKPPTDDSEPGWEGWTSPPTPIDYSGISDILTGGQTEKPSPVEELKTPVVTPKTPTSSIPTKTSTSPLGSATTSAPAASKTNPFGIFPLDSSAQMLTSTMPKLSVSKMAELHQLFNSLTPEMKAVLSDRGITPPTEASMPEMTQAAGGGLISDETSKIIDSLTPKYISSKTLLESVAPQQQESRLGALRHLSQGPLKTSGLSNRMSHGGLPQKYAEAAPEGHHPEFITGVTGYYAQGGGTGQSDDIPAMLHDGDFVMDADTVASLGDGSSKAGAEVLEKMRKQVPHREQPGGTPVPAKIADGEYVFPASFVTAIGGGSNKVGSERLNEMREKIRAHKRSAPTTKIPPKAKSPLDYLKMAKG